MLAAFWWFEARYLRTFEGERAELFSGDALRLPAELQGPGPVRFVHFWDPGCPCNVGNQQHLQELLQRFAGQPVDFYEVRKPGSKGRLPQPLAALKPLDGLIGRAATGQPGSWHLGPERRTGLHRPLQRGRGVHLGQQLRRADPRRGPCRPQGTRNPFAGGGLLLRLAAVRQGSRPRMLGDGRNEKGRINAPFLCCSNLSYAPRAVPSPCGCRSPGTTWDCCCSRPSPAAWRGCDASRHAGSGTRQGRSPATR